MQASHIILLWPSVRRFFWPPQRIQQSPLSGASKSVPSVLGSTITFRSRLEASRMFWGMRMRLYWSKQAFTAYRPPRLRPSSENGVMLTPSGVAVSSTSFSSAGPRMEREILTAPISVMVLRINICTYPSSSLIFRMPEAIKASMSFSLPSFRYSMPSFRARAAASSSCWRPPSGSSMVPK